MPIDPSINIEPGMEVIVDDKVQYPNCKSLIIKGQDNMGYTVINNIGYLSFDRIYKDFSIVAPIPIPIAKPRFQLINFNDT